MKLFLFTTFLATVAISTITVTAAPNEPQTSSPATGSPATTTPSPVLLSDPAEDPIVEPIVEDVPDSSLLLDEEPQQQQPQRVSPLAALFRRFFGNRGANSRGEQEGRLGTTANKPLVTFGEQSQQLYVQLPTKTSASSSLANQPRVASVTLGPAAGRTTAGRVIFFQENLIQPVSLIATINGIPVPPTASLKLEIRSSSNDDCSVLGPLFNPTGVENGGIITTTGASTATGFWNAYITALPIYRISTYDPNSIVGRSLVLSRDGAVFACGRILHT